jgi:hypothetical protein
MATYKLTVPTFDGKGGPLQARNFVARVTAIGGTSEITEEHLAQLAAQAFKEDSPAGIWLANHRTLKTAALDKWKDFQELIEKHFARPPTHVQLFEERKKLVHKLSEPVDDFWERCMFYQLTANDSLPAAVKASAQYPAMRDAQIRTLFLEGLAQPVREKLGGLDLNAAATTSAMVRTAARSAQVLMKDFAVDNTYTAPTASSTSTPTVAAIQEFCATDEGRAFFASAVNNFRGRGRGRGRGSGSARPRNSGPAPAARAPRPSPQELANRPFTTCGRCHQSVKHYTPECTVQLDAQGRPLRPVGRGGNRGARGGRGRVAAVEHPPPQQAQPGYWEPLN